MIVCLCACCTYDRFNVNTRSTLFSNEVGLSACTSTAVGVFCRPQNSCTVRWNRPPDILTYSYSMEPSMSCSFWYRQTLSSVCWYRVSCKGIAMRKQESPEDITTRRWGEITTVKVFKNDRRERECTHERVVVPRVLAEWHKRPDVRRAYKH